MKAFDITWIADGIYHHTRIEAETEEEAKRKFYNMASNRAIITHCEELPENK